MAYVCMAYREEGSIPLSVCVTGWDGTMGWGGVGWGGRLYMLSVGYSSGEGVLPTRRPPRRLCPPLIPCERATHLTSPHL